MRTGHDVETSRRGFESAVIDEFDAGHQILITGPPAGGKTHTLDEIAQLLRDRGTPFTLIHAKQVPDPDKLRPFRERSAAEEPVLLCDDLDQAGPELAGALGYPGRPIARFIATATDTFRRSPVESLLLDIAPHGDGLVRTLPLPPLDSRDVSLLTHHLAPKPIDAVTEAAIRELAWGRPGWVTDLVRMLTGDVTLTQPFPGLGTLPPSLLRLPSLRRAADWTSHNRLDPQEAAVAVSLSQVEPRTLTGAGYLVDMRTVDRLLDNGVLAPTPFDPDQFSVPPLYAAAIAARTEKELLQTTRLHIARQLTRLQAGGILLSAREVYFCARALSVSHDPADHDGLGRDLLSTVAADYLEFGRGAVARDLLLGTSLPAGDEPMEPLTRIRTAAVLHGPLAGMRVLGSRSTGHPNPNHDEPTPADFGALYLRERLGAELQTAANRSGGPSSTRFTTVGRGRPPGAARGTWPQRHPHSPGAPSTGTRLDSIRQACLVCSRWNDDSPLDDAAQAIVDVRDNHPVPEIALSAAQLLNLECLMSGRLPETSGDAHERSAWIAYLALYSPPEMRDLMTMCTVAEGLILLFSGEVLAEENDLIDITERLPAAPFHRIWATHLTATTRALAAGNIARAAREWELLRANLPHFLPQRIRTLVDVVGRGLRHPEHPTLRTGAEADRSNELTPHKLLSYFRGALDDLDFTPAPEGPLEKASRAKEITLTRLARAHLSALHDQHPQRLLEAADELCGSNRWAAAAYALREARDIYARRGATRSVADCDVRLQELNTIAAEHVGWFDAKTLDSTPFVRLTPRQLNAAQLAAQGLSNKEIAEQMHCSVRTAESHIAQARAKLGATDRKHLATKIAALIPHRPTLL